MSLICILIWFLWTLIYMLSLPPISRKRTQLILTHWTQSTPRHTFRQRPFFGSTGVSLSVDMIFQILDSLDRALLLTGKLLNQGMLANKLKSSIRTFHSRHHDLVTSYGIPFITTTIPSYFPLSWLITGFVTRVARRVWPVAFGALEFTISLFFVGFMLLNL